jgi:glucokinase
MRRLYIGVDVGGTKIAYGLFNENKELMCRHRTATDPYVFPDEFGNQLVSDIDSIVARNGYSLQDLKGVCIGMPSSVDFNNGIVLWTSNMINLKRFHAREYFSNRLPGVEIIIDNDTNLAAIAEHRRGAGRGYDHIIYTALSTGVGSGFIINNQLFRGTYGGAGESGHMIITPDEGIECGCGNRGCIMSYSSGSMVSKHVVNAILNGRKTMMYDMVEGDLSKINGEILNDAFRQGDDLAIEMLAQIGKYIGIYVYNLFMAFNINCYVFGGGLLNFGQPLFDSIRSGLNKYYRDAEHEIIFKTAELGNDAGIIGAVELLD